MRVADEDGGRAPRANQSVVVSTKRPLEEPPEKVDGQTLMRLPVDPTLPRCRWCHGLLALMPLGYAQPSVDAMNLELGLACCQSCLMERLRTGTW